MSRFRPSLPVMAVVLFLATGSAEVWLVRQEQRRAHRALAALEPKKQERDWLARQSPAPDADNEAAIAAALTDASQTLARLRDELGGQTTLTATTAPSKRIDEFFALTEFVEKMRERAARAQVAVKPTESFGFASYVNEGPMGEILPLVHRQRVTTEYLVEALLEAGPLALVAVNREQPAAAADEKPPVGAEDYFALPRPLSLRQSGLVETDAFRLEFTGPTSALRNFLNTVARSRQPVIVRTVEVEPLNALVRAPTQGAAEPGPLIRPPISKFSVTVEVPLVAAFGETMP